MAHLEVLLLELKRHGSGQARKHHPRKSLRQGDSLGLLAQMAENEAGIPPKHRDRDDGDSHHSESALRDVPDAG